jgi:hypothetical protein
MIPGMNFYKLVLLKLGVLFILPYKLPQVNSSLEEILFMISGLKQTGIELKTIKKKILLPLIKEKI